MDKAKNLSLNVIAYTIDDPDEAIRLIQLGVKGITTNRPDWLKTKVIQSLSR
jgi:glycerophosphoryl diester phosphodiesterase